MTEATHLRRRFQPRDPRPPYPFMTWCGVEIPTVEAYFAGQGTVTCETCLAHLPEATQTELEAQQGSQAALERSWPETRASCLERREPCHGCGRRFRRPRTPKPRDTETKELFA